MADGPPQDEDLIISFFPDPPPFFKHFTTENQERLKELEKEAAASDDDDNKDKVTRTSVSTLTDEQILALPTELRYLIPPAPPADNEEFKVFGLSTKAKGTNVFMKDMEYISSTLKSEYILEDWTYEQLYPSSDPSISTSATLDRQNYLFRFVRSILLSYISLLGIVASNPVSPQKDEKLKDILTMVTNMHSLINEYRPHQARETLIEKMEQQVQRKKSEIEGVRKIGERVRGVLEGFGRDARALCAMKKQVVIEHEAATDDVDKASQRLMWETMDEILGH